MGVQYILVNFTKKEKIDFTHLGQTTKRVLSGSSENSAIVTWYMIENIGDRISMIPDQYEKWLFFEDSEDNVFSENYKDVTNKIVNQLIEAEILVDKGLSYQDEDDPSIYERNLKNIWND